MHSVHTMHAPPPLTSNTCVPSKSLRESTTILQDETFFLWCCLDLFGMRFL